MNGLHGSSGIKIARIKIAKLGLKVKGVSLKLVTPLPNEPDPRYEDFQTPSISIPDPTPSSVPRILLLVSSNFITPIPTL